MYVYHFKLQKSQRLKNILKKQGKKAYLLQSNDKNYIQFLRNNTNKKKME